MMKRSTERILTTHVGSLARPVSLLDIMKEKRTAGRTTPTPMRGK